MSRKRLDPQKQHDLAPSARECAADKTTDAARTENRMSHTRDRKHGNIDATPRDAVYRRRSSDDAAVANLDDVAFADSSPAALRACCRPRKNARHRLRRLVQ